MTWQRISRFLAVSSLLLLALAWIVSCLGNLFLIFMPITTGSQYRAGIWSGSLRIKVIPHEIHTSEAAAMALPLDRYFIPPGSFKLSDFNVHWEERKMMQQWSGVDPGSPLGEFRLGRTFTISDVSDGHYWPYLQLSLPLWFLWLLFIVPALLFCRRMQRRSTSGMEKQLATTSHSDREEKIKSP